MSFNFNYNTFAAYQCFIFSHALEVANLFLIFTEEHLGEAFEGVLDIFGLQGTHLEEFEADALCKG
jgi:hypothetical protein